MMKGFIKWQVFGRMGASGRRKKKQKKHSLWFAMAIFCMFFTITVFADSNINNRYEGCDYAISAEEAATFEQVEAVAEQFKMAYIRDDMTLFEKEMAIIEYLLVHVDYDYTYAESSHWAYGALFEGKAVCDGYTKAFMELANVCGIETKYVLGNTMGANSYSFNGIIGIVAQHAWNLVKLDDGEWYHVDVTFADSDSYYSKYNYDKNQLRASGEYDGYIEGLGPLWINYINYSDGLLELTTHKWNNTMNAANGYLYGPKVADEYFMNGVIDLSLAKPEDQLNLTIKQEKANAHNQRTEEILADFTYVIPFTTWDETMSAAKSYLSAAPLNNVRLAVKYENQEAYTNAQQGHSDSFTVELMKQIGQYGRMTKLWDWSIVFGYLDYLPTDGQQPVYDIFYSHQIGTYGPSYYYDE